MKILVLNAGSSSQKSCLYDFKAEPLAAPSRALWEAEIDWTHHQGVAELKVATAHDALLEETLKSESRAKATAHVLRTLWSGKTKIIAQPSEDLSVGVLNLLVSRRMKSPAPAGFERQKGNGYGNLRLSW